MARTDTFKVGQKVRRLTQSNITTPKGFEGVIQWIINEGSPIEQLWFSGSEWGYNDAPGKWELVAEDGPVRAVTRQEIVPGTYDGVSVKEQLPQYAKPGHVNIAIQPTHMDHTALTRAAAVLTALAEALRDGE